MAPFDPEAFVRAPAPPVSGGFDPEAFVKKTAEPSSREKELRVENLKKLLARGEPGYTERVADQVTSGLMRPISGVMRGVTGVFDPTSTFGERYRAGVGAEEDYYQRSVKNTPGPLGVATDVVGSIVGAGKATGPASLTKQAVQSGVQGAVEGAARNAEDVKSAAGGAAVGGATSAAASTVIGALTDRLKGVAAAKRAAGEVSRGGSSETLKEAGSEIYKRLDDAGIKFKDATALADDTAAALTKSGYNPAGAHSDLVSIVDDINKLKGQPTSWSDLQKIRERIAVEKASDNKQVRRLAGEIGDTLDRFIDTAKPTIPAKSIGTVKPGDPGEARDLWRRGSQAEVIDYLADKGSRLAGDPATKLQQNFQSYQDALTKPGRYDPFANNPTTQALMDRVVEGSPKTTAVGKALDKWGNNLVGYGSAGVAGGLSALPFFPEASAGVSGTGATAIGLGLLAKGGGSVARRAAAQQGMSRVDDVVRSIVGPYAKNTPIPRDILAKILAEQDLKRAVGNYAASNVNAE